MTPGTRACVAYVVGRVVLSDAGAGVRDCESGVVHRISGTIRGNRVGLYDYERRCNVAGTLAQLHDDGAGSGLELNLDDFLFDGRDLGTGRAFSGWVSEQDIHLLDDAESRVFVYTLLRADAVAPGARKT